MLVFAVLAANRHFPGSRNGMSTAFAKEQYDQAYDRGIERHWWHRARNRIVFGELRNCALTEPRVLDVGCGRGIAVKYLRDSGVDCDGVELARTAVPLAGIDGHVRYGVNAVELPAEERARYDVVTLLDVIEHLPDPQTFVASIVAAFPRLAYLIVTVPARKELWSNYDEFFGHHCRYDLEMLRTLARSSNLDLVGAKYFFHTMYLPARLLSALNRPRSTRVDPPRGIGRFVHGGIAAMMLLDYHCLPGFVPGSSAVACMKVRQLRRS